MFRGQITDDVLNLFKENNIKTVFILANMTNLLQLLDLTVNVYAKIFCRKRFNHWYIEQITEHLDNGKQIEEVDVKLQLNRSEPLHAEWLVELFNHMTTSQGKEIIMKGWKASRTIEVIKEGSARLSSLDPFNGLDQLLNESSKLKNALTLVNWMKIKY